METMVGVDGFRITFDVIENVPRILKVHVASPAAITAALRPNRGKATGAPLTRSVFISKPYE